MYEVVGHTFFLIKISLKGMSPYEYVNFLPWEIIINMQGLKYFRFAD